MAVRYGYSDPVINNDNQLRIFPRDGEGQLSSSTEVWSIPSGRGVEFKDRFGNRVRRLRVMQPHTTFIVAVAGTVLLSVKQPVRVDIPISGLLDLPESFEYTAISPLVDPESVFPQAVAASGGTGSLLLSVAGVVQWVYENI